MSETQLWHKSSQAAFSFEDKEKHTSDKTISKKENRAPNPSELVWGFISQGTEGNKSFAALPKMTFPPLTQQPDTQTRHPPTTTNTFSSAPHPCSHFFCILYSHLLSFLPVRYLILNVLISNAFIPPLAISQPFLFQSPPPWSGRLRDCFEWGMDSSL